jgi:hypothetical protein
MNQTPDTAQRPAQPVVATGPLFALARPYWKAPFRYEPEGTCIFDADGSKILDVRGWGHLTGRGAWKLPEAQAEAIQDQLGRHLALVLNTAWANDTDQQRRTSGNQP